MKRRSATVALSLLVLVSGSALAAVVHVSGHGQSYDPGIALEDARADAAAECVGQGGTPIQEVYNHVTRANVWLADSLWTCEVP
ncbi:hypothetical protein [Lysobacter capsici]|uniref:hypothetical protein n=1 Tax=Lysobacter capsici TaxID=435897 RepID=UPI001C0054AE|nr:hypothetical protein [Lysobacter capsici]QWF15099.1 hypothetical protein KME82_14955 [Lysobacter capsici]